MKTQSKETGAPTGGAPEATDGRWTWRVAAERSRIGFRVRKMGLYHVKGRFREAEGRVELGPDGIPVAGELSIDPATISTRIPARDWHLRTRDFLDVRRHPRIEVRAEEVNPVRDGGFRVRAAFEIHGQEREVALEGHLHAGDPDRPILHLHGVIDRHDFGIQARQPVEMVVGAEVGLEVQLALERAA